MNYLAVALSLLLLTVIEIPSVAATLTEVRSIDGRGNNLSKPALGSATVPFIRISYPHVYPDDGSGSTMFGPPDYPNARTVSNHLNVQSTTAINNRGLSDFIWQWGQFVDHDISRTQTLGGAGSADIPMEDPFDPLGPLSIPFERSNYVMAHSGHGAGIGRQQINDVTSYLDASHIYGSDLTRAEALRTFSGGHLQMSAGDLPALNTAGLPNQGGTGPELFLVGDTRANEQVALSSLHTIFAREHNRLADLIASHHLASSDEEIYQLARKLVGAEMQIVTYREYLPALLGTDAPKAEHYSYDPLVPATITQTFASALFRFGHSMVSPQLMLVNDHGVSIDTIQVRDSFFNSHFLVEDPDNVELLIKGLATQPAQELDLQIVDDLRSFLFGPPGAGGFDLAALNIQRGRDHGLPNYNLARFSYDLPTVSGVDQITSDEDLQQRLVDVYGDFSKIDLWVAGLAEDHLNGSSVGPLMNAVIVNQFERLRDGDRLFYLNDRDLYDEDGNLKSTIRDIIDLDSVTLSQIIKSNTGITNLQSNLFFTPAPEDFNGDGVLDVEDIHLLSTAINTTRETRFDVNGDGRVDPSDHLTLITESLNTWVGDSNLDGQFESGDLVNVFSAGLYEHDQRATWETGDWNGDGWFDTADLVAAFQDGGFEVGIRPASAVPEPTSLIVSLVSVTCVSIRRSRFSRASRIDA